MRDYIISALVVFLVAGGLRFDPLGMIRYEETVHPGEELVVYVNAINELNENLNNVRVSVFFHELDLFAVTTQFDLENNGRHAKVLSIYIPPDTPKGLYLMQISMQNENDITFRERDFRYVWVV